MIGLNRLSLEVKLAALFGAGALLLSTVVGFIAGVRWGVVLLRAAIMTAVFAGIGFGICLILKRFVPELYEALVSMASFGGAADRGEDLEAMAGESPGTGEPDGQHGSEDEPEERGGAPAATASGEFHELDGEGLPSYSSRPAGGSVDTRSGKLGKHILEQEKLAKYEPKVMAQAVRTMMNRERD